MVKIRLIHNDAISGLRLLEDDSIDCVVTSPPYFGLRNYGTAPLVWERGDQMKCEHNFTTEAYYRAGGSTGIKGERSQSGGPDNARQVKNARWRNDVRCRLCNCVKTELGQERYVDEYLDHIEDIMSQVWRVLKPTGTMFLNIGDSFNSAGKKNAPHRDYKVKDMMLIPQRMAIRLQEIGWFIRSEIIWSKINPSPDPAKDRPSRSHETVWLLTKSSQYYWDNVTDRFGSVWDFYVRSDKDHRAVMPMPLAYRCILLGCPGRGTVLDMFAGVGTSALAAKEQGKNAVLIDISEANIKAAKNRILDLT